MSALAPNWAEPSECQRVETVSSQTQLVSVTDLMDNRPRALCTLGSSRQTRRDRCRTHRRRLLLLPRVPVPGLARRLCQCEQHRARLIALHLGLARTAPTRT